MSYDPETLKRAYARTEGRCHICQKKLAFSNYGQFRRKGAWEIEHSVPRSKGGTDHGNNLYVACIACNRSKGNLTTRTARARNGFSRAPYSRKERNQNAWAGGAIGSLAALILVPPPLRLAAVIIGAGIGAIVASE